MRILFSAAALTSAHLRGSRVRLGPFVVRVWVWREWPRFTLPFEVTLKRFFAPLCDLSFGTALPSHSGARDGPGNRLNSVDGIVRFRIGLDAAPASRRRTKTRRRRSANLWAV